MSSNPVVKNNQHYLNISKAFGLLRLPLIGFNDSHLEILVSEFFSLDFGKYFDICTKKESNYKSK
jgi:hypothetical protein